MAAEWTKIRSVRSTVWTYIIFAVVTIGITALITWLTESHWYGPHAAARNATFLSDPTGGILDAAVFFGQLVIGVLGVLVISTEYTTGVIRASLLAVPRRLHMLAAKVVVFTALLFVVAEVVCFCSFFIGSAILHSHLPVSLGDHNVTRAVIGTGLYLTVIGIFSLAIGALIRHTAGGIATTLGSMFLLPIFGPLLPSSWGAHVNAYLPEQAGAVISHVNQPADQLLSAWQGLGVLCIWAAVLLIAAAILLQRRDA
jgi:ABC-type transport system involved in multi-copper enzyme maturation permease subunit